MKVAVLTGGNSSERDVAVASAAAVVDALSARQHQIFAVDVATARVIRAPELLASVTIPRSPPPPHPGSADPRCRPYAAPRILELLVQAELAFLAVHGGFGEDGHLQATLETFGIPHTGPPAAGCAVAFHKPTAKALLCAAGIPTPDWQVVYRHDASCDLPPPVVVKPVTGGSTVGISLARSVEEIADAARGAIELAQAALIERYVDCREFTVGVLGGRPLAVVEVITHRDLFDYEAKYQPGLAQEIVPADLPRVSYQLLQSMACQAHYELGLSESGYSRVDFRFSGASPYCLEVNPLPGLTPASLLPKSALGSGLKFPQLCEEIIRLAPKIGT